MYVLTKFMAFVHRLRLCLGKISHNPLFCFFQNKWKRAHKVIHKLFVFLCKSCFQNNLNMQEACEGIEFELNFLPELTRLTTFNQSTIMRCIYQNYLNGIFILIAVFFDYRYLFNYGIEE